jgi:hypothetical protein
MHMRRAYVQEQPMLSPGEMRTLLLALSGVSFFRRLTVRAPAHKEGDALSDSRRNTWTVATG